VTRALITRPVEDAQPLADALAAHGIEAVIEPLLTISALPTQLPPLDGVRALLFSSANGVRAFAAKSERRDLAVFAVGPATAEAARAAGFTAIETAEGDAEALARLVVERLKPDEGRLIHVAGSTVTGDLAGGLAAQGYAIERIALYDAVPADALSARVADELAAGRIDWVLLFSPRTAAIFARLVRNAGRADALKLCTALCLSPAVAEAVSSLPWHRVRITTRPDQANLLALAENLHAEAAREAALAAKPAKRAAPRAAVWPAVAAAAATVAILVGALGATVPLWRDVVLPVQAPGPDMAQLDALGARVDRLQRSVAAPPAAGPAPQRLAEIESALNQRIAALSQELDGVRAQLASVTQNQAAGSERQAVSDLDARLAGLAEQITALQQHAAQTEQAQQQKTADAARSTAFALGVAELDGAARAGRPFAANLAALRRLAPDPAAAGLLDSLDPLAAAGVATVAQLKRDWPDTARRAKAAQVVSGYDGWLGHVMEFLESAITIRRIGGGVTGDGAEALLARAGARLDEDDLAGAVALLAGLPEPAAREAKPWLARARGRLAAEAALGRLVEQALGAGSRAGG
jgi:uroporphyrinogen-III synthase